MSENTSHQPRSDRAGESDLLQLPSGWLAAKVTGEDLRRSGGHENRMRVCHGTLALLKINGEPSRIFEPGIHPVEGLAELTIVSTATFHLAAFTVSVQDRHGMLINIQTGVGLRIAVAQAFDAFLLRGSNVMTESDLIGLVAPHVSQATRDEMLWQSVLELDRSAESLQRAGSGIADRLAVVLGEYGLEVGSVNLVALHGEDLLKMRSERAATALASEYRKNQQENLLQQAEQQRFEAQLQHDVLEYIKGLENDSSIAEDQRKLHRELRALAATDKLDDSRSKKRIADLIRQIEEVRYETALKLDRASGDEDLTDMHLKRRLDRREMAVRNATLLGQIGLEAAAAMGSQAHSAKADNIKDWPAYVAHLLGALQKGGAGEALQIPGTPMPVASDTPAGSAMPLPATSAIAEGMRMYRRSVGVIVAVSGNGKVSPLGTAWGWKGQRNVIYAATNAHVCANAEMHRAAGSAIEWRLTDNIGSGLPVDSWQKHPIYREAGSVICGGPNGKFDSHDAALMKLRHSSQVTTVKPLVVASSMEIRSLSQGALLAVWCCPFEGLVGMDVNQPQATFHKGEVVALSDYHFNPVKPGAEVSLIQHSMPAVGGSSGSPVFALFGKEAKVVGVFSAGNSHLNIAQLQPDPNRPGKLECVPIRLPSSAQHNFAMSANLFRMIREI